MITLITLALVIRWWWWWWWRWWWGSRVIILLVCLTGPASAAPTSAEWSVMPRALPQSTSAIIIPIIILQFVLPSSCILKTCAGITREMCSTLIWEGGLTQIGWIVGKVSKGEGVIFNPKNYVAKFGPLNRTIWPWNWYKGVFLGYVFQQLYW